MTAQLEVDQVALNDNSLGLVHQVQVSLSDYSWGKLVREVCRATYRASVGKQRPFTWMTVAGSPVKGDQRKRALAHVRQILGHQPPSWLLSPEEATSLAQALLEAAEEPRACACGNVVEQPSSLTTQCSSCEERS